MSLKVGLLTTIFRRTESYVLLVKQKHEMSLKVGLLTTIFRRTESYVLLVKQKHEKKKYLVNSRKF